MRCEPQPVARQWHVTPAAAQMQSEHFKVQTLAILESVEHREGLHSTIDQSQASTLPIDQWGTRMGAILSLWSVWSIMWSIMQYLASIQIWSNNSGDSLHHPPGPGLDTCHVSTVTCDVTLRLSEKVWRKHTSVRSSLITVTYTYQYSFYSIYCNILMYFKSLSLLS